jgi:hypothetical protein
MSWLYRTSGEAAGYVGEKSFHFRDWPVVGRFIHALDGKAIGQLIRTHVHAMSGPYVGELHDDQVVDMQYPFGNIGDHGNPGNGGDRGNPGNRGDRGCTYPDVFYKLLGH